MEETGNEQKGFHKTDQPPSNEKDTLVGPFGDNPSKKDRQRKRLLTWLKETQQKREENNKRIFSRWLSMVDKNNVPLETSNQSSPKKEPCPVKPEFSAKIHSIPYDAFYTMTPIYYTVPEYWMMPDQNVCYYNQMQRPTCPCYPYCLQNQAPSLPFPPDVQVTNNPPMPSPINSAQTELPCKQESLQFNLTEWYTTLEEIDTGNPQAIESMQNVDNQNSQQPLDYPVNLNAANSVTYSTTNIVSGGSNTSGDFS